MGTLYDELLAGLTKQASSTEDTIKQGIAGLDNNELLVLAAELAELTGDKDLADMAKILPVYSSGVLEKDIETEQVINNVKPDVKPEVPADESVVVASKSHNDVEKLAEGEEEEEASDDKDEEDEKEDAEDKEEMKEEEKQEEKSAAEVLYDILKEGAAIEELIEVRAAQMVDALIKEAEDAETARTILDAAAGVLTDNAVKAYEYSTLMMDKAKTVAGAQAVNIVDAAKAVVSDVLTTAKAIVPKAQDLVPKVKSILPTVTKIASVDIFDELDKRASEIEAAYEKIAEQVDQVAEQLLVQAGMAQGLQDPQLHDFVMKGLDAVRTLAAKKDINIAQAAKEYLSGETGAITGIEEPITPSPSQAPSPAAAPINSNLTQSPDQYIPQMIANIEPAPEVTLETQVSQEVPAEASPEVQKAAATMLAELFKQAGINFSPTTDKIPGVGSLKQDRDDAGANDILARRQSVKVPLSVKVKGATPSAELAKDNLERQEPNEVPLSVKVKGATPSAQLAKDNLAKLEPNEVPLSVKVRGAVPSAQLAADNPSVEEISQAISAGRSATSSTSPNISDILSNIGKGAEKIIGDIDLSNIDASNEALLAGGALAATGTIGAGVAATKGVKAIANKLKKKANAEDLLSLIKQAMAENLESQAKK